MKNILIIDIETTGFLPQGKIAEVGIVELDLETGDKRILYDKVMHEFGTTLEEVEESWIVTNGYMTTEEIVKSITLEHEKEEIQSILDAYPLGATAFNNAFDFGFLEKAGFEFIVKLQCPMKLSTDVCKIMHPNGRGYKWPKVQEAWEFFFGKETGYVELHRGADDAFHEADIVKELYDRGIFKLEEHAATA